MLLFHNDIRIQMNVDQIQFVIHRIIPGSCAFLIDNLSLCSLTTVLLLLAAQFCGHLMSTVTAENPVKQTSISTLHSG